MRIHKGQKVELFLQISNVVGITGETPTIEIQRDSDDKWLKADLTWQVAVQTINLAELDSTDLPGYYNYEWTNDGYDEYRVHYFNGNGNGYGTEQMESYIVDENVEVKSITIANAGGNAITLENAAGEDILEQIWSAVAGRMQLENSTPATATQIEQQLYEYDNSTPSVKLDIKKPDGSGNTTQLDAAAMAGRNV